MGRLGKLSLFWISTFVMFPTLAMAADWAEISSSKSGAVWSVDVSSIKTVDEGYRKNIRRSWIKIDYSMVKSEPAREAKVLFFFDCDSETAKSTTWINYRADGSVLRDLTNRYPTYDTVVPETVLYGAMEVICGLEL